MSKKAAFAPENSAAMGPYSPALVIGDQVFISGQAPISSDPTQVVSDSFEEQVERTFSNLDAALKAAGCTLDDCVKVTVYLSDINNFARMNAIYKTKFARPEPTRTTVQAVLWSNWLVEIDAVAIRGCAAEG